MISSIQINKLPDDASPITKTVVHCIPCHVLKEHRTTKNLKKSDVHIQSSIIGHLKICEYKRDLFKDELNELNNLLGLKNLTELEFLNLYQLLFLRMSKQHMKKKIVKEISNVQ